MSASRRSGTTDELGPDGPGPEGPGGSDLLAALLDGMDAALCAFDADGVVTHWNREAERILGWTAAEAVGRHGFAGWAVRPADAEEVEGRLMSAMRAPGRQVHEFALLTKEGGRVLVRTQSAAVRGPDGRPAGLYCAFSEVHTQIDLERSIALSEALFERGQICGACFEVRCREEDSDFDRRWCISGTTVAVTATNFCAPNYGSDAESVGGHCNPPKQHFVVPIEAFEKMAIWKTGTGNMPVEYRRYSFLHPLYHFLPFLLITMLFFYLFY